MKSMKASTKLFLTMCIMVMALCAIGVKAEAATQINPAQNSITITWTPDSDAEEYYVGIGLDSSSAEAAVQSRAITLQKTQTSYTFLNLAPGTEYYVYVWYKYSIGSKVYYDGWADSGYVYTTPAKVTGVNQINWYYWALSCNFGWNKQSDAKYEYIVKDNKGKVVAHDTIFSDNASFDVKNTIVYSAQVRAVIEINDTPYYGEWSDTAYLFTQPMVNEKKTKLSNGSLKIVWGKVNGVTGYDVYVSNKEKTGYKKVKSLKSSKNSVTIKKFNKKKISKKKKYYVYIVGKKKVGSHVYTSGRLYTFEAKKKVLNWTF